MFNLFLPVVLYSAFIAASKGCELVIDEKSSGVFLQEFGPNKLILDVENGYISIAEGATVQGYCNSGFRNNFLPKDEQTVRNKYNNVTFLCENGQIYYISSPKLIAIQANSSIMCYDNQASFFMGPIDYCSQSGLVYGVNIDGVFIVFAEVCYNMINMRVEFIHFVAGKRSSILEHQVTLNPSNITYQLQKGQTFTFPNVSYVEQDNLLRESIEQELTKYQKIAKYAFKDLAPLETYSGRLKYIIKSFKLVNTIPSWTIMRDENWKFLQKIIDNISIKEAIDIYVGTSGTVQYPANDGCYEMKNFTYKVGVHGFDTIPLQIWQYIKPRDASHSEVVIVQINSPFLSDDLKENVLKGTDICNEISWLHLLEKTRRMPALGYLYCIASNDAAQYLQGFPHIK